MHFDCLPDSALVRARDIAGIVPVSRTTLWRHVKAGSFPSPVKLPGNVTAWRVGEVRAWLKALDGERGLAR